MGLVKFTPKCLSRRRSQLGEWIECRGGKIAPIPGCPVEVVRYTRTQPGPIVTIRLVLVPLGAVFSIDELHSRIVTSEGKMPIPKAKALVTYIEILCGATEMRFSALPVDFQGSVSHLTNSEEQRFIVARKPPIRFAKLHPRSLWNKVRWKRCCLTLNFGDSDRIWSLGWRWANRHNKHRSCHQCRWYDGNR